MHIKYITRLFTVLEKNFFVFMFCIKWAFREYHIKGGVFDGKRRKYILESYYGNNAA